MLIFAANDGIDMLANSSQWFGGGTYKLCPQVFLKYIQSIPWSLLLLLLLLLLLSSSSSSSIFTYFSLALQK